MLLSFIIYASILLTIVYCSYKKHTSEYDFVVGGRSLNFWVTAISAHASDMSSWLFLAYPAIIFTKGVQEAWIGLGLLIGMFLNWHFIAPKLRTMTEKLNSLTLSSFLEARFKDRTGFIRVLTAIICLVFFTFYISSGLQGAGYVFEIAFNLPYHWGVSIGFSVAILYTVFGGFITVAWTDFFQGLFLVAMVILVPLVVFFQIGGASAISAGALSNGISLKPLPSDGFSTWVAILMFILAWGPGYFGQPHILTKFMGIKNPDDMYKSKYFGMSWQLIALTGAVFVGIVALGFFPNGIDDPQFIFIRMTKICFHPFIAGFVLCGILAATISTVESQILVQASLLSEDFYKRFIRKSASSHELLWASRFFVVFVGGISFIVAFFKVSTIYQLVMYSWAGLGAAFGPIIILSLYSKSVNRHGAVASIIVGGISAAVWKNVNKLFDFQIPELIPAFLLSLGSAWIFSYLARNKLGTQAK
ncbi:MAG: High-affinity proline transporter PutP [Chlamydiae bacterium]|nr:High-affinity proline transporter PutP [Chlamydiota bacterium]